MENVSKPFYPVATTRKEMSDVLDWLIYSGICVSRAEAMRTLIGPLRGITLAAHRQWLTKPHDVSTPPCLLST